MCPRENLREQLANGLFQSREAVVILSNLLLPLLIAVALEAVSQALVVLRAEPALGTQKETPETLKSRLLARATQFLS